MNTGRWDFRNTRTLAPLYDEGKCRKAPGCAASAMSGASVGAVYVALDSMQFTYVTSILHPRFTQKNYGYSRNPKPRSDHLHQEEPFFLLQQTFTKPPARQAFGLSAAIAPPLWLHTHSPACFLSTEAQGGEPGIKEREGFGFGFFGTGGGWMCAACTVKCLWWWQKCVRQRLKGTKTRLSELTVPCVFPKGVRLGVSESERV